eukprot:8343914-Pyramimonas_sp.AAC.1
MACILISTPAWSSGRANAQGVRGFTAASSDMSIIYFAIAQFRSPKRNLSCARSLCGAAYAAQSTRCDMRRATCVAQDARRRMLRCKCCATDA